MNTFGTGVAPDERLLVGFPWQAWGAGWAGIVNGALWLFYEAVLPSPEGAAVLLKYFVLGIAFVIGAFGVWHLKNWARFLLMAAAAVDLAIFAASAAGLVHLDVLGILNASGRRYSLFLPFLVYVSGPVGDILMLGLLAFAGKAFREQDRVG